MDSETASKIRIIRNSVDQAMTAYGLLDLDTKASKDTLDYFQLMLDDLDEQITTTLAQHPVA